MRKTLALTIMLALTLMGTEIFRTELSDATKSPDFELLPGNELRIIDLPPLPAKKGLIPVLRCNMYVETPKTGGCNEFPELSMNETPLTRFSRENERLLNRAPAFHLKDYPGRSFPVFSGPRLLMVFAPDIKT